jgi:transposase-like protein
MELRRRLIERAAGAELTHHLGYDDGEAAPLTQPNRRNGTTTKTLRTVDGPLQVALPRDREGSFEPQIVPKHKRTFDGFDDQILALYAGGMSTRDIQRHLATLYGVDVSDGLISQVTTSVSADLKAWRERTLEPFYAVVYLDAMIVSIREERVVKKRAIYVAIGVNTDGERDVLGLWIQQNEGAKFWATVLTDLKNRGVGDILFVCTDGLGGFPDAIEAIYPQSVIQTCVVHLIRQACRYLSYNDRKAVCKDLRRLYTAPNEDAALAILEELEQAWSASATRTAAIAVWRRAWDRFVPFLAYPEEIRRIIYTTNAIESLHMQIRKTIKTRGHFPNDEAALRLVYLAIIRARENWRMCYNWKTSMGILRLHFGDRIPE